MLPPLVLVCADMTILHLWLVFLPLYLTQRHRFSLAAAGALISIDALAYALAQPFWGRILDRHGYTVPLVVALATHGALITLLPLIGGRWLALAVLLAFCGALNAGGYPGCVALAASRIGAGERGRAMGLIAASSDVGQVAGPSIASAVYFVSGAYEVAFAPAVVVGLGSLALAWAVNGAQGKAVATRPPLDS